MDSRNTKAYRIGVTALLTAGTFINAVDRASLAVAAPVIIKEFHINAAAMGFALSAFFWAYTFGNIPAGSLADRFGAKTVLGWAAAIWSLFSAATGLANNVTHLVAARFGVGLGEAAAFPCNTKIVASNFPSDERGTAIGTYSSGVRLGMAVTPVLMAFLIQRWGWRTAFYVTGLGSLAWCVFWYLGFRDFAQPNSATVDLKRNAKVPWKEVFANRAILGILVAKFTQDFLQYMFMTWIPAYLVMERGFSIIKMGIYGSLPWIAGFLAQPLVGYFSDWLIKRGWSVNRARKTIQVSLQVLAATVIIVGFVHDAMMAVFILTIAIGAESTAAGMLWTIISEVVPPRQLGSIGGMINTAGAIGGVISPTLTGIIVKTTGSFQLALTVGGCSILMAAAAILFVVPELKLLTLGSEKVLAKA
jgi:ACS family glucarate transporter-like MFS transporter